MRQRNRLVVLGVTLLALLGGCGGGDPAEPLLVFGGPGHLPGQLAYPRGGVATADRFYMVDKTARIAAFAHDGAFLHEWRTPAATAGKPVGISIGPEGEIVIPDTHYSRILIYAPTGELEREIPLPHTDQTDVRLPTDVAYDSRGFIYVSEYGHFDRINKFAPDWTLVATFGDGRDGVQLLRPQSLVVTPDDTLWVADGCNHRLCHFDADGRLLATIGGPGTAPGELRFPYGIDLLPDGTLVVAEYGNNRLQRFSPTGRSLGTWGSAGRAPGQLSAPWAVSYFAAGRLLVVDSGNNRGQVIPATDEIWSQTSE